MRSFLESEKAFQAHFKKQSGYFSPEARADGIYKGAPRPFCLPRDYSIQNLFPAIREAAQDYFARYEIKWHDGQNRAPSNHLCDSQVCCVNFLFPFAHQPEALKELLSPLLPHFAEALPIEDGKYVAFEWIGQHNYLGEKISRNRKRTRGANFTSADAAVLFRTSDGRLEAVLIEWKYTEAYPSTDLRIARSGTDRLDIYRPLLENDDSPIIKTVPGSYPALFYEPFYQFMRQQLLAHEMEKAHELGASKVTLLHVSPEYNKDFSFVTSPSLRPLGTKPTEVWPKLLTQPDRFIAVSTEDLFRRLNPSAINALYDWWRYISGRYRWIWERAAN